MKKVFIVCFIILLWGCKTKKNTITKTEESEVIEDKSILIVNPNDVELRIKNRALEMGIRLLEACNTSKFKPFTTDEATESVIKNATLKTISETCKKINFRNGKFISLNLIDVKHDDINKQYIFKYSINYEKKYFKRELTIFVNSGNKVSAISTKEVKPKPM